MDTVSKSNPEMASTHEINVTDEYVVVYRYITLTFKVRAAAFGISGRTTQKLNL